METDGMGWWEDVMIQVSTVTVIQGSRVALHLDKNLPPPPFPPKT